MCKLLGRFPLRNTIKDDWLQKPTVYSVLEEVIAVKTNISRMKLHKPIPVSSNLITVAVLLYENSFTEQRFGKQSYKQIKL